MVTVFPAAELAAVGLNRQAVFARNDLPAALVASLPAGDWQELVLLGHGGRRLWQAVTAARAAGTVSAVDPIDEFTVNQVERLFSGVLQAIIYPGPQPVGLQALGELAGWHHASPFRIGIDAEWGSWFAYRAVLLTRAGFLPTPRVDRELPLHPCASCRERPCLQACPADALRPEFALDRCASYRLNPQSACASTCLARLACPLGQAHRYETAQIEHSYLRSLAYLQAWARSTGESDESSDSGDR